MTPEQLREAVKSLPYTQAQIAEMIGVSYGHLRNALSGTQPLGSTPCPWCGMTAEKKLRELAKASSS